MKEVATFAAGCFWGVEHAFMQIPGVINTRVGYSGGEQNNPTYEDVCTGETGHHEVVEVTFDSEKIKYTDLLKKFWEIHDPTTRNRQGLDMGEQYHSVIFYHSEEQRKEAEESKKELEETGLYKNNIVTDIEPIKDFYEAEEYHQKYIEKTGRATCN